MGFEDRRDAGRQLAARLAYLRDEDAVVVGLPNGGVPVAYEVARELNAPMDVIVVRKLGVPYQPELAFGALGEGGIRVVDAAVLASTRLDRAETESVERRERRELVQRADRLRQARPQVSLSGRTIVVVDDGIATGATARAACQVAWAHGAQRVVLAVPVAPRNTAALLRDVADEVVCLQVPTLLGAVGGWYRRFDHVTDSEVERLLRAAARQLDLFEPPGDDPPRREEEVVVPIRGGRLAGHLTVPEDPLGLVVFAHGSGSSRHSPRNRFVGDVLGRAGLATLLMDLLTGDEENTRARVFDIELLARRLVEVTHWVTAREDLASLRLGYFGASTGAAAALRAATDPGVVITTVVSRGGRPDLTGAALEAVRMPTLLIVGGNDQQVLELNRWAARQIPGDTELAVVPGATHLFAEPGTLERVAELARDWLVAHLSSVPAHRGGPGAHGGADR
ncbi:phosphoribosyltransferase family protein [Nocardia sienata]|uniref:phosphoribosyltransferase family protein n=1 Tax=Nocardia sienata TaxID=248552 RepID=UPI0007A51DC8|nr:phosphoribosyltransferase family protein [Nocardia sienata]